MKEMPDWWLTASGLFFILGSVAMILLTIVAVVLVWAILDLKKGIVALTGKVETLTEKVSGIADQVQSITTEVGTRATGITRMVDDVAGGAIDVVEKFAPLLLGAGAVIRMFSGARRRRRGR
jgi:hypothetical protein